MKKFAISLVRILGTVAFIVILVWLIVAQPSFQSNVASREQVDPARLRKHVETLAVSFVPRDYLHETNLENVAVYIGEQFRQAGARVESEPVIVGKRQYRNVIGRFGPAVGRRIVIGAHYDTCGETPGADDNASAIASLIELGYLFGHNCPTQGIELVAYVLEEPPFFRSRMMGSAVHARNLAESKADIEGVIVLEMVGYFMDDRGSQLYPSPLLRLFYPSRGNFIGVVGPWDQGRWLKRMKVGMKGATDLPVCSIRAPSFIPGVDFSDHMNYWPYGFNALMVTDTAFYRNQVYHGPGDTPDRLDYGRMAKVVLAVSQAVRSF